MVGVQRYRISWRRWNGLCRGGSNLDGRRQSQSVGMLFALAIVADHPLAARPAQDARHGSGPAQRAIEPGGIVAFVFQHITGGTHGSGRRPRGFQLGHVAECEHQRKQAADEVGKGGDLGRPAAPRPRDRPCTSHPFLKVGKDGQARVPIYRKSADRRRFAAARLSIWNRFSLQIDTVEDHPPIVCIVP